MEHDESHFALVDPVADPLHQRVWNFMMRHVAPPQQHVGAVQDFIGKAVVRVVEGREPDVQAGFLVEERLDQAVNTVRVDLPAGLLQPFVPELVPNCNIDRFFYG